MGDAANGWVSCAERLPDDEQLVLVYCHGEHRLAWLDGDAWVVVDECGKDGIIHDGATSFSHWQPLTEPEGA
jgi:hypothetical protein